VSTTGQQVVGTGAARTNGTGIVTGGTGGTESYAQMTGQFEGQGSHSGADLALNLPNRH
jgi:hypothetical protein